MVLEAESYTNSTLSQEIRHSGNASLHLVANGVGVQVTQIVWQSISPAPAAGSEALLITSRNVLQGMIWMFFPKNLRAASW